MQCMYDRKAPVMAGAEDGRRKTGKPVMHMNDVWLEGRSKCVQSFYLRGAVKHGLGSFKFSFYANNAVVACLKKPDFYSFSRKKVSLRLENRFLTAQLLIAAVD